MKSFEDEIKDRVAAKVKNINLIDSSKNFMNASLSAKYSYSFSWLGRPIIQYPQNILVQDIETGLIFNQAFNAEFVQYDTDYQNEHCQNG